MRFNKYIFLFLFIAAAAYVQAQQTEDYNGFTINKIEVSSNRIKPEVLKNYFPLKQGDSFSQEKYLHAQNELHDLRIAKNLDFTLIPKQNNKLDISIKADDGYYVFPLFFITGGSNSAAGLALATGNLFKRGETLMFFGGAGQNGEIASIMLKEGKNIYNAFFSNMNFDQRFYKGGWINNTSVFNTGDDEQDFKNPLSTFYTKKDVFNFTYARKTGYFLFSLTPQYEYIRYSADLPSGNYNNITFAVKFSKNIRSGANMGALFGYGLTDKEQSLKDLSAPILGYGAQVAYQNGGKWSGADFNISKLSLHLQSITELKTRHLFNAAHARRRESPAHAVPEPRFLLRYIRDRGFRDGARRRRSGRKDRTCRLGSGHDRALRPLRGVRRDLHEKGPGRTASVRRGPRCHGDRPGLVLHTQTQITRYGRKSQPWQAK